ncbi:hypothetical protein [Alteromonas flava]|uniref:hypothetical protein n=1 Tax=Alteromonas flava TaxID=2048003 RepID=UPI000C2875B0|nr:hypothetical protein [Alteromonas flava]
MLANTRKIGFFVVFILAGSAVSCSSLPPPSTSLEGTGITALAEISPQEIAGEYLLTIQTADKQGAFVYLNTKADLREPDNITVTIPPALVAVFEAQLGAPLEQFMLGKTIAVTGKAKRVLTSAQQSSDVASGAKYYYQTHIRIKQAEELQIVNSGE